MDVVKSFEDLFVWKKAMDLVDEVYRQMQKLPKSEMFGLSSQMGRAAVSIPSNIAEGQGRGSTKEFINFLNIARGSRAELRTQLLICVRLGYIPEYDLRKAFALVDDVGRLLNLLIASLKEKD